jgi:DNA-binding LacI/PurR family transcriptional regulator
VFVAADEWGYRINRAAALMTARRYTSSALWPIFAAHFTPSWSSTPWPRPTGYEVVLGAVTPTHAEPAVVETLLSFRCEGLIVLGLSSPRTRLRSWRNERRLSSSVGACRVAPSTSCAHRTGAASDRCSTTSSSWAPADLPSQRWGGNSLSRSQAGHVRAMKGHGLSRGIDIIDGDFTERSGMLAAQELLRRRRRPTAVCAGNDQSAIGTTRSAAPGWHRRPRRHRRARLRRQHAARLAHIDLTTVSQAARAGRSWNDWTKPARTA